MWSKILNKDPNLHKHWLWSYLFVKQHPKLNMSAKQRISNMYCMNNDYNKKFELFKFQSGYRKIHLNSPKSKQEMSLKKTNGVGLKKEENITQARLSTCT